MTTRKAPAGQGEGMSTTTDSQEGRRTMHTVEETTGDSNGNVLLPRNYQPTPTEVDAAEKFQDYEVGIRYNAPVEEDSGVDGKLFRWAGVLEIVPQIKAITIRLAPGAREQDLEFMQWQVRRLLGGYWNAMGFTEKRSLRDSSTWWRVTTGYPASLRLGRYVEACTVTACVEHGKHHMTTVPGAVEHETEVIEHRAGWYRLRAVRTGDDPWRVDLDVDEYLDVRAGGELANDLAWALGAVAKLNTAYAPVELAPGVAGAGRA